MDCIFCKIIKGEIKSNIIYQDDNVVVFHDINPQAPHHLLIVPKKHIATINDVEPEDAQLIGDMVLAAKKVSKELGIAERGYRLIFNCNKEGGQLVYHIHLHLLGGAKLSGTLARTLNDG